MFMSEILIPPSAPPPPKKKRRADPNVWEFVFSYRSRGNLIVLYFIFNFLFDILCNGIYLTYVPKFG